MSTFKGIRDYLFSNIVEKAEEFGYSEQNILILRGDTEEVRKKYPALYDKILGCWHNSDKRDPFDYARDLVANWLFEDWFVFKLRERGVDITLSGVDSKREILSTDRVTTASDTVVKINGKYIGMELAVNFTGYWKRNGRIDLRDNKYLNLLNHENLLCAIDLKNRMFTLLDIPNMNNAVEYEEHHEAWGNKPCYSIILTPFDLEPFMFDSVVGRLEEVER